jgi:hypothetical protein
MCVCVCACVCVWGGGGGGGEQDLTNPWYLPIQSCFQHVILDLNLKRDIIMQKNLVSATQYIKKYCLTKNSSKRCSRCRWFLCETCNDKKMEIDTDQIQSKGTTWGKLTFLEFSNNYSEPAARNACRKFWQCITEKCCLTKPSSFF